MNSRKPAGRVDTVLKYTESRDFQARCEIE
jgi:hypothetical protein